MKKRILGVAFGVTLLVGGFTLNTQNAEARRMAPPSGGSYDSCVCTNSEGSAVGSACQTPQVNGPCSRASECN